MSSTFEYSFRCNNPLVSIITVPILIVGGAIAFVVYVIATPIILIVKACS